MHLLNRHNFNSSRYFHEKILIILHAFLSSADFFKSNFLKKFFQEYHEETQQLGPR